MNRFFFKFHKFEMKMFRNFFRVCFFCAIQKFSKFKFLSIRFFFEIRRLSSFCLISFLFRSRLFSFFSLSWFWKNMFSLKNAFQSFNFNMRLNNNTNSASMNRFLFEKKTKIFFWKTFHFVFFVSFELIFMYF